VHYLVVAFYSFRRSKLLTVLMVLAVAFGITCSTTMVTVLQNLAGNPLPSRSDMLFHPQIDPRPAALMTQDASPPDNLSYLDAMNLLKLGDPKVLRAAMSSNWLPAKPAMRLIYFNLRSQKRFVVWQALRFASVAIKSQASHETPAG
jgi:putative ABC transport system permease protein